MQRAQRRGQCRGQDDIAIDVGGVCVAPIRDAHACLAGNDIVGDGEIVGGGYRAGQGRVAFDGNARAAVLDLVIDDTDVLALLGAVDIESYDAGGVNPIGVGYAVAGDRRVDVVELNDARPTGELIVLSLTVLFVPQGRRCPRRR